MMRSWRNPGSLFFMPGGALEKEIGGENKKIVVPILTLSLLRHPQIMIVRRIILIHRQ